MSGFSLEKAAVNLGAMQAPETFTTGPPGQNFRYRVVPGTTGVHPDDRDAFMKQEQTAWEKAGKPPPPIAYGSSETPPNFDKQPPAQANVPGSFDLGTAVANIGAVRMPPQAAGPPQDAAQPAAPSVISGTSSAAEHAMTLGADDWIKPAIAASINSILRPLIPNAPEGTWSQDFDRFQKEHQAERHAFAEEHPVAAVGAEVAGGLATPGVGQLFGAAAPGAGVLAKVGNYARNLAAGTGLGAATGFGMAEGGLPEHVQGAEQGAALGGVVSAAAPAVAAIPGAIRAAAQHVPLAPVWSQAARERQVAEQIGKTLDGAALQTSPVGPLDLAQATGSPEMAAKVRFAEGVDNKGANAIREQQANAAEGQVNQIGDPATAPDSSATFTGALRKGSKLARTEETRLWTVPKLANTEVHVGPVQDAVNDAVAALDPVLRDAMPGQLKALVNRINKSGTTTVRDLNGIRSDLERIARNSIDGAERAMARNLSGAFMDGMDRVPEIAGAPAGIPTGGTTYARDPKGILRPVPEMSPPIVADPEIAAAYQTARDYTRRMRTLFNDPEAAGLLKTAEGVYRTDPSEGARRFFNFSNGSIEGPQSIAELAAFIDTLKAQPGAGAVAQELRDSARSFVAAALSKASRLEAGQNFNPKTMQDFLRINGPWMRNSGLFEQPQIEAVNRLMDYATMLRRTEQANVQRGSPTSQRMETSKTFTDQIMSPWMRHVAEAAAVIGGSVSHGGMGTMLAGGGAALFERAVTNAERTMRELMAAAVLDSRVAADLQRRVTAGNSPLLSPQTKLLMQRLSISAPTAEIVSPQTAGAAGSSP